MASNRAKLSLRRTKKPSAGSQASTESHTTSVPSLKPPRRAGVAMVRSGVSDDVDSAAVPAPVVNEAVERGDDSDKDDFHPLSNVRRKRKTAQYEPAR